MAKSVADVAIMFGAMESASPDPNDPATRLCTPAPGRDYTKFLKADGLKGARIGIPRASFYDAFTPPGPPPPAADAGRGGRGGGGGGGNGLNPEQKKAMDDAIAVLKAQGAIIIDPANIPSVVDPDPKNNFLRWNGCSGANNAKGQGRGLLGRAEVRDEARLQQLAEIARRRGAGEDADRAARMEHRARQGRRDQVRAVAARHLRRDGRREGSRALRGRSREGHPARRVRTASTRS